MGTNNITDFEAAKEAFKNSPEFFCQFVLDNNPQGLQQVFKAAGLQGAFTTGLEMRDYLFRQCVNGALTPETCIVLLFNVPFDEAVINYTTYPIFRQAYATRYQEYYQEIQQIADNQARQNLSLIK